MKKGKTYKNVPPPPPLETGGVVSFIIQNHQKVSLTLDYVASASPFVYGHRPHFSFPFLPFSFFAPPWTVDSFEAGGYCWQGGGKEMGKVDLGNGRRWLGSMVGWLGDMRGRLGMEVLDS